MKIHSLVLGDLSSNCYIWEDENTKNAIVIDAPAQADRIIAYAEKLGLKITDVILTHGHFDHMLALKDLCEKTGASFLAFHKTEDFLKDTSLNLSSFARVVLECIKPDKLLYEGDIIDFYGNEIKLISTPGHTEDSICLLCGDTLISGDTLFSRGVGRWDFPTGNGREEINSIKEKLYVLADDTKVYPGHGPSTTIGEEKRENPYTV